MQIEEQLNAGNFRNPYVKVGINIQYTASWVSTFVTNILKEYKITIQQYNVLRILELHHPESLSIKNISDSMVDLSSNVSRLVDKLVHKKLVEKHPETLDKRKVQVSITPEGLKAARESTELLVEKFMKKAQTLTLDEANLLSDLLDKLRG